MTETTKIILTGIASSAFTILLTKVMDLIQNERTYRIELKKQFFEKKLYYAEKTIEYLNERAEIFERAATVLRQIDFIKSNDSKFRLENSFDFFFHLNDALLRDLKEEDIYTLKIPAGFWLYFDINPKDLPHQKLNVTTIHVIKDLKRLETVFSEIVPPTSEEIEKVQKLPGNERMKWVLETMRPLLEIQGNFHFWSTSLFEVRNDLQTISMKIEREFSKYK